MLLLKINIFLLLYNVSCSLAGVSRSVTIAAAYLMSVTSMSCKDSLKVLRGARSIANPNCGFQKQLHQFEFQRLTDVSMNIEVFFFFHL